MLRIQLVSWTIESQQWHLNPEHLHSMCICLFYLAYQIEKKTNARKFLRSNWELASAEVQGNTYKLLIRSDKEFVFRIRAFNDQGNSEWKYLIVYKTNFFPSVYANLFVVKC